MKIYGIPGLGADERVYQELNKHLKEKVVPLKWIKPLKNESLNDYLQRFKGQIDETEKFVLIGVSFGGMVASELCKHIDPFRTILISSCATRYELPWFMKMCSSQLLAIIPAHLLKPPFWVSKIMFGVSDKNYRGLLKQILADTEVGFLKLAMIQILDWKNDERPKRMSRIHGKEDKVLPFPKHQQVFKVNGGHFAIVEQAAQIAEDIETILESVPFADPEYE